MTTTLDRLRYELNHSSNQDIPMESIKDLLIDLLDELESEMGNGGSQIFTGWTSDDSDPANVDSNGGTLNGQNPSNLPTDDEKAALDGANSPSGSNVLATFADIPPEATIPSLLATENNIVQAQAVSDHSLYLEGRDGGADVSGSDVNIVAGGGNNFAAQGAGVTVRGGTSPSTHGKVEISSEASTGVAGQALVSNGANSAVWRGIQVAAGVPSEAPLGLPFAFDTTMTTGGFYFWNGEAWVKVATIL